MKVYEGTIDKNRECKVHVVVDARHRFSLNPRLDLANKSPTGFAWGYLGSGPAQLALAILADCYGDDEFAKVWFQGFKARAIANLKQDEEWSLSEKQVREVMQVLKAEAGSFDG